MDCFGEHRHAKEGGGGGGGRDVQLLKDANGAEYLEYSERQTVKPRAFSVANAPTERIPVFVYKTCEKRPSSMRDKDAPF